MEKIYVNKLFEVCILGINIFGVYESISQVYFALILYCDSPEQRTVRQKNTVRVDTHETYFFNTRKKT